MMLDNTTLKQLIWTKHHKWKIYLILKFEIFSISKTYQANLNAFIENGIISILLY